jgi:hypothetical protein
MWRHSIDRQRELCGAAVVPSFGLSAEQSLDQPYLGRRHG